MSMVSRVLKKLPPGFPQSSYLQEKWWHRLAWVLSITIFLSSTYFLILSLLMPVFSSFKLPTLPDQLSFMYTLFMPLFLPALIPSSFLRLLIGIGFMSEHAFYDNSLEKSMYVLLFSYAPVVLYKLILFIAMGDRWKDKQ